MPNILNSIHDLYKFGERNPLNLVFNSLDIQLFHNRALMHKVHQEHARLRVHKPKNEDKAKMTVLDHLVFQFSFHFVLPKGNEPYMGKMKQLPTPLANGQLQMDKGLLVLEFLIVAPSRELQIEVRHTYSGLV